MKVEEWLARRARIEVALQSWKQSRPGKEMRSALRVLEAGLRKLDEAFAAELKNRR